MTQREKMMEGYIEFELLNGRSPNSVFELTKKLKLKESDFYDCFGSLDALRSAVLSELMAKVNNTLDNDENYGSFTSREKLLAVFYTLFGQMQEKRSYLLARYGALKQMPDNSRDWKPFMALLKERVQNIVTEARASEEIQDRPLIGDHYAKGFQLVFVYLFRVWVNDDSADFTTTDAAIEKSVNLSFDLLGASPLDSLIDFGRFAFKTKVF